MKKNIGLLIVSLVIAFSLIGDVNARAGGDAIATIKSQFASINKNIRRYKKVKRDLSGYSAEGGTLEAYFDGKSIKKIVARFYGEMGRTEEEYYYWNDKLIFLFQRELNYNRPLSGKVISTKENRYYFDNGQMIRWIDENGRQVPSSDSSYSENQNEYLENSQKFMEVARSKES